MDEIVAKALAKWPDVPAVYGWLSLDRRGNWRIKEERVGNAALREFIARNYARDSGGSWFFQNGPQRVFVRLAYTPLIVRTREASFVDQCGRAFESAGAMLDNEGSVLLLGGGGVALLDDRDLAAYADAREEALQALPRIESRDVADRFGFIPEPKP